MNKVNTCPECTGALDLTKYYKHKTYLLCSLDCLELWWEKHYGKPIDKSKYEGFQEWNPLEHPVPRPDEES